MNSKILTRRVLIALMTTTMTSMAMAQVQPGAPPAGAPMGPPQSGAGGAGGPPPGMGGGPPPAMSMIADTKYHVAIHVNNGAVDAAQSTPAAITGGTRGDTFGKGLSIKSAENDFGGVLIQGGTSAYTLSDSTIDLHGTGHNDFLGIGAGAMADKGVLILRHVNITTNGPVASATIAAEGSVMRVFDSTLIAHGGPLPAYYKPHIGPGMMEPPPPLKIRGTARTNITMSNSESYFYNSTIQADGWGALSTDATGGYVYLEANDCKIIVNNSGYGTYADFGAHVVINRGTMNVATFGAVIAGAAEVRFNDVTGTSGGNAIMIHSVMGNPAEVGKFQLTGGSYATKEATVLIKSANADVVIDGAKLTPANGVLVQTVVNDDPNATKVGNAHVPGSHITFRNGDYNGNVLHQDKDRFTSLALEGARLTGVIDMVELSEDAKSHWIATGNSRILLKGFKDTEQIDALAGVTIDGMVGEGTTLTGNIKLTSGGILQIQTHP